MAKAAVKTVEQSLGYWNFIVLAMLISFIIFITARGRLGKYLELLIYVPPAATEASKPVPGEHKEGTVNSDDPKVQEKLRTEEPSFGPLIDPVFKLFRGK